MSAKLIEEAKVRREVSLALAVTLLANASPPSSVDRVLGTAMRLEDYLEHGPTEAANSFAKLV